MTLPYLVSYECDGCSTTWANRDSISNSQDACPKCWLWCHPVDVKRVEPTAPVQFKQAAE